MTSPDFSRTHTRNVGAVGYTVQSHTCTHTHTQACTVSTRARCSLHKIQLYTDKIIYRKIVYRLIFVQKHQTAHRVVFVKKKKVYIFIISGCSTVVALLWRSKWRTQTGWGSLTHQCLMESPWEHPNAFHSSDTIVLTATCHMALVNLKLIAEPGQVNPPLALGDHF